MTNTIRTGGQIFMNNQITPNMITLFNNAGTGNAVQNSNDTSNCYGFGIANYTLMYNAPILARHQFNINGNEALRIASNSYVGINNTNPIYQLDLTGNQRISSGVVKLILNSTQGGGGTISGIDMYTYGTNNAPTPGASLYCIDDSNSGGHMVINTKPPFNSTNSCVERFRVTDTGLVGINNNNPKVILVIV
ncbi:MAG: hypothetical protein EOP34_04435 [Rickettsiales bacterium]|nr:MAG: hypothetical protein EOP34_04435 [Rickettsiales bacterium]